MVIQPVPQLVLEQTTRDQLLFPQRDRRPTVFGEPTAAKLAERLRSSEVVVASPLLEAEVRSAACREGVAVDAGWMSAIQWIHPARSLTKEIDCILDIGYLRGADCWHLATALYLSPDPIELVFLTEDRRQREVAIVLGFRT